MKVVSFLEYADERGGCADLGVALPGVTSAKAKVVNVSLDQALYNGAHMVFQQMPPTDLCLAASAAMVVHDLIEILDKGRRDVWPFRSPRAYFGKDGGGGIGSGPSI